MQDTNTERQPGFFERLNEWRKPYVADKQFMLLLSFFVGLLAAVARALHVHTRRRSHGRREA